MLYWLCFLAPLLDCNRQDHGKMLTKYMLVDVIVFTKVKKYASHLFCSIFIKYYFS